MREGAAITATEAADVRELSALFANHRVEVGAIVFHRRRGMSRRKLVVVYGADLVDMVLGAEAGVV